MTRTLKGTVVGLGLVAAMAAPRAALAGPPLLCHPFDIGGARSLPWDGTHGWSDGQAGYPLDHLVSDTQTLLTPSTPVIVRMETLRRASIYASRDANVASALLSAMTDRVAVARKSGKTDVNALLDAAYVTGALTEMGLIGDKMGFGTASRLQALVADRDAYTLVSEAVTARPDDPALQFAAALIANDRHRAESRDHAQKARAGASRDALLARNLNQLS